MDKPPDNGSKGSKRTHLTEVGKFMQLQLKRVNPENFKISKQTAEMLKKNNEEKEKLAAQKKREEERKQAWIDKQFKNPKKATYPSKRSDIEAIMEQDMTEGPPMIKKEPLWDDPPPAESQTNKNLTERNREMLRHKYVFALVVKVFCYIAVFLSFQERNGTFSSFL